MTGAVVMKEEKLPYAEYAVSVSFTIDSVWIELAGGHFVRVWLRDLPALQAASLDERAAWSFVDGGKGVSWPETGVEIRIADYLAEE